MDNDIQSLIARITREVLKRLNAVQKESGGVLAVFAGYVFDADGIAEYLKGIKADVTCALFAEAQFECDALTIQRIETKEDRSALAARLKEYDSVVLITPPLGLLRAVADGDDSDFTVALAIRPLLWGKDVTLLLDFDVSAYRRSTLFAGLPDVINALEGCGARITLLRQKKEASQAKDLITEQDVKDAHKDERIAIATKPGAIVTQLARDTAKELGVIIETGE